MNSVGKLLSKCNILHFSSYLHFEVIYYITILLSEYIITLLFSYFQQNAQLTSIEQLNSQDLFK